MLSSSSAPASAPGCRRPGRRVAERARLLRGEVEQLLHRPGRHRLGVDDEDVVDGRQHRHRREVGALVRQAREQRRVDRDVAGRDDADRVAVGRRLRDRIDADVAGSADLVVDDHGLAERFAERLAEDAAEDVGQPAGRERHG